MIQLKVHGDVDTKRAFERLKVGVQKRVARKALRPAGSIVSKALKKSVPRIDDDLAWKILGIDDLNEEARREAMPLIWEKNKTMAHAAQRLVKLSIGRKAKFYKNSGTALEAIGPRYSFRIPGVPISGGYVAQLLELGDEERAAFPFMRRAFNGVAQQAGTEMAFRAAELVKEEARKARRASRG